MNFASLLAGIRLIRVALFGFSLAALTLASMAAGPVTNTSPQWPPLSEVLKKWGDVPLDAVQRAAESGDLTAQHYLGYCYAEGLRVAQSTELGLRWYERAYQAGYMPSASNIGVLYERGKVVLQDLTKAAHYFRLAAERGMAQAQVNLGLLLQRGAGVQQDYSEAMKWFQRAAHQGHTTAFVQIGRLYRFGQGVPQDTEAAIRWFQKAVEEGDPLGQVNLGLIYEEAGAFETALKNYQEAANRGNTDAMFKLYDLYKNGKGVDLIDHNEALKWLSKAAEAGSPNAQVALGRHYEVPQFKDSKPLRLPPSNLPEAVRWYQRSADQNWAGGIYYFGICCLEGKGVKADEERGLELIRKAADRPHIGALLKLAELYASGIGEPRNPQEVPVQLLERVAKSPISDNRNSVEEAHKQLVFRYKYGVGMDRDLVVASQWYCRAALAGVWPFTLEDKLDIARNSSGAAAPMGLFSGGIPGHGVIAVLQPEPGNGPQFLKVLSLYLKAAQSPEPREQIAQMYHSGEAVPQDLARAWLWFTLAAETGGADARAKALETEARLTNEDLNKARQLLPAMVTELSEVQSVLALLQARPPGQKSVRP